MNRSSADEIADNDSLAGPPEITSLGELTPLQWRTGIAAWLGWLFDGLDGTLYIMVSAPFVAELLHTGEANRAVSVYGSYIQAAFLVGWAAGGAFFGRIGDRFGRSRTISLTILTYALFTGLAFFAQTWWQLLIFRFLAALGIGGEWAAGSSLVSETWPRRWRPIVSSFLQSAYQCGFLLATFASFYFASNPRRVFLIGILPALIVFWIRRAIPEPDEWQTEKAKAVERHREPGVMDLFGPGVRRTTILTILVCSVALSTIWAFLFWSPLQLGALYTAHLKATGGKLDPSAIKKAVGQYKSSVMMAAMVVAIAGNFGSGIFAKLFGYRKATLIMFLGGLATMYGTYAVPRDYQQIVIWLCATHFFVQGVFGLFPLYIPPLFPTLLRTTGAGFSYNIGRVVAAVGTVVVLFTQKPGQTPDYSQMLKYVSFLYIPGLVIAMLIPEPNDIERRVPLGGSVPRTE